MFSKATELTYGAGVSLPAQLSTVILSTRKNNAIFQEKKRMSSSTSHLLNTHLTSKVIVFCEVNIFLYFVYKTQPSISVVAPAVHVC